MNPFLNASLYSFRKAWQQYNRQQPRYTRLEDGQLAQGQRFTDLWRHQGEMLRLAWEGLVVSVVEPQSALAFRLWLSYRERIRNLWLKRGGYFYTRHGNVRQGDKHYLARIRKKLTPKVPENWKVDLESAEQNWRLALDVESAKVRPSWLRRALKGGSDFQSQLAVVMLAASGVITGRPDAPTLLNGLKRKTLLWSRSKKPSTRHWWRQRWGWQRIAGMKAAGWLESFGDGRRLK